LPFLKLAPLVIDRSYVDATSLVTQYNRHTFSYARTLSTTRAHATVHHFGALSSITVSRWCRWSSGWRWTWFWWTWASSIASHPCVRILDCATLARKAAIHFILTYCIQLSFHLSFRHEMLRKLTIPRVFLSDYETRCVD
jgi:hypothetical protein